MALSFADAADAVMREYAAEVRAQLSRPLFWDPDLCDRPPDPRPFYGPDAPGWVVDGACGFIDCKCCNSWREYWDDHCC